VLQTEPVLRYGRHSGVVRQSHLSASRFGKTNQGVTSDNAGPLPGPLAETGESFAAMGLPVFHAALVQPGDVGDQALQGTCNLFGTLTVATITQSKESTHEARIGAKQLESRTALATGLQEGIGPAINHTFTTELGGNVRVASTRSQAQLRKVL
jgi:hypothetical protein